MDLSENIKRSNIDVIVDQDGQEKMRHKTYWKK